MNIIIQVYFLRLVKKITLFKFFKSKEGDKIHTIAKLKVYLDFKILIIK